MGSRGAYLKGGGFKEYRYHTIMRYNNVRFVVQNEGSSIKLPEMSNSRWAVYATLGKNGEIKSVSFYNGSRKKYKEIDFKNHKGMAPHVHAFDQKIGLRDDKRIPPRKPTAREMNRVQHIVDFYERHDLQSKSKEYYRNLGRR